MFFFYYVFGDSKSAVKTHVTRNRTFYVFGKRQVQAHEILGIIIIIGCHRDSCIFLDYIFPKKNHIYLTGSVSFCHRRL